MLRILLLCVLLLSSGAFAENRLLADDTTETKHASGSELGFAVESLIGMDDMDVQALVENCDGQDNCHLLDVAVDKYPIPTADAPVEGGRRALAGVPNKHDWANALTHHCANEGGWCSCDGHVTYTKKCAGTFSCSQADWNRVVSEGWNSNHKENVDGGIRCSNSAFGGDPFGGHDKQCFCHPHIAKDEPVVNTLPEWSRPWCYEQCGNPYKSSWFNGHWWKGFWCGFSCTGDCPVRAAAFLAGREHVYPIGRCASHCYCVVKGWTG